MVETQVQALPPFLTYQSNSFLQVIVLPQGYEWVKNSLARGKERVSRTV